jgi:acetyl-CoA carboxylase carboxyltransferase component
MTSQDSDSVLSARAQMHDSARPDVVRARHDAGFLMPRERINLLLDPGSMVEYGSLSAHSDESGWIPTRGGVDCVGTVHGFPVVASSTDYTDHGGGYGADRINRLIALAHEHRWPMVLFADGGGSRASDPRSRRSGHVPINGSIGPFSFFDGVAELSGRVPTIAVVSGPSYAGHASLAGLSNLVIATRGSSVGMGGPPMVEAALGIRLTHQELAPVEMHDERGGIDLLVDDEPAAIENARRILSYLHDESDGEESLTARSIDAIDVAGGDYDMRPVLNALVDEGSLLELRRNFSTSVITGLARVGGKSVGVIASQPASALNGAIDQGAADKIARFVELCDVYEFPLVALVDTPGFILRGVDKKVEFAQPGMTRHHVRPFLAHHHRTVPLFSVQLRRGNGLAPFALTGIGNGRSVPALRLAWPTVDLVSRDGFVVPGATDFDDVVLPSETRARILGVLKLVRRAVPQPDKKHPVDTW